jgi:Rieske 2Fe-2S family protein
MDTHASGLQPSLPSDAYRTPESFAADRRDILARDWVCAGRTDDIGEPGDHLVAEVAGESVLVVRDKAGALHAHYNVCRHRGARLCDPGSDARWGLTFEADVVGRSLIRCPYHGWAYGLDGHLVATPGIDGIDKALFGLHPVGVAEWGGFLFLNLSPLLALDIGPAAGRLGNYPLADLITARTLTYDVRANWKLILENYNECYHCAGVHPELCEIVPEFRRDGGMHLDWDAGIPHRDGAVTYTASGTTRRAPFPRLTAEEQVRHKGELIYPNLMLSVSMDHAAAFLLWPLAHDLTRIECRFLFHPDEAARDDFDPSDAVDFWDLVNRQDWAMCERVQAGISSRVHDRGFYSPMEDYSLDIRRYVAERRRD